MSAHRWVIGILLLGACRAAPDAPPAPASRPADAIVQALPYPDPALDRPDSILMDDRSVGSGAWLETSIMTAPNDTVYPGAAAIDSVAWALSPDSCSLMARLFLSDGDEFRRTVVGYWLSESWGTSGFGEHDVVVSPDWLWYAGQTVEAVPARAEAGALERLSAASGVAGDALRRRIEVKGKRRGIVFPYVTYMLDPFGSEEPMRLLDPLLGLDTLARSASGVTLLIGDTGARGRMHRIDPRTSAVTDGRGITPYRIPWVTDGAAALPVRDTLPTPQRRHQFVVRGDSIFAQGADQRGQGRERFVAKGRPIQTTRNGEFLLVAEHRGAQTFLAVIRLTLSHGSFRGSCDRGG